MGIKSQGLPVTTVGGGQKGTIWRRGRPFHVAVLNEPFPLILGTVFQNGPERSRRAVVGAATRTLDGEDRSEMITGEGGAKRAQSEPKWYPRSPPLTTPLEKPFLGRCLPVGDALQTWMSGTGERNAFRVSRA